MRRLLVQGAQSVVNRCAHRDDPISRLAQRLVVHKTRNAAVMAVTNRLARIIYAVIQHREPYRYGPRAWPLFDPNARKTRPCGKL